jgi:hypothetical protein
MNRRLAPQPTLLPAKLQRAAAEWGAWRKAGLLNIMNNTKYYYNYDVLAHIVHQCALRPGERNPSLEYENERRRD